MAIEITFQEFLLIQKFIEDRFGIILANEKKYLLDSKLSKILKKTNSASFEELYAQICTRDDHEFIDELIDAITVNETFWFRDKTPWLILEDLLLGTYIAQLREGKRDCVRIWSSACSYGQEPYSIAMCIDRYLKNHDIQDINLSHFEILATDISRIALRKAQKGVYDNIAMQRGLEEPYKQTYFHNNDKHWRIDDSIRNAVKFQQLNLIKEFFPSNQFDIIFFRNVLIYFSDDQKIETMAKIKTSLQPEGTFFIGSSELLIDNNPDFNMAQHKNGCYFQLAAE